MKPLASCVALIICSILTLAVSSSLTVAQVRGNTIAAKAPAAKSTKKVSSSPKVSSTLIVSSSPKAKSAQKDGVRRAPKPSAIQKLLRRPVKRVDFDDAPFEGVINWVKAEAAVVGKINVVPRWRALLVEGIDKDTPVTLRMEDTTVGQVLTEILDLLSGRDPLVYVGVKNTLRITTRSDTRGKQVTRAYNVGEMLAIAKAARIKPCLAIGRQRHIVRQFAVEGAGVGVTTEPVNIETSLNDGSGGNIGRGNTRSSGCSNDSRNDNEASQKIAADLMRWITTTVEPDTWAVNGGTGTLAVYNQQLIVHNSADVHALLGGAFLQNP